MSDPYAPSDALRMARQWIETGQPERALTNLQKRLDATPTAGRSAALRDLAWAHWWLELQEKAIAGFRAALDAVGPDEGDRTVAYLASRDLGLALASVMKFDESLKALERATHEEKRLVLPPPPSRPLLLARAEISLYANQPVRAEQLVHEVMTDLPPDSPHAPFAMVIGAEARAVQGMPAWDPFLSGIKKRFKDLTQVLVERTQQGDPQVLRHVAGDLLEFTPSSGTDILPGRISLLNTLAQLHTMCRDNAARADTLALLVAAYDDAGDAGGRSWAELEWVRSMIDLRRLDEADRVLTRLESLPQEETPFAFQANLARQRGRFHATQGRNGQAEESFRLAIAKARQSGEDREIGRAEVVLGIHLQHGGQETEAIRWIDLGLEKLEPEDDHAKAGMSHRECLIDRKPCPCLAGGSKG